MLNEEFNFIQRQPILCGLMKYRMFAATSTWQLDLEHHQKDMFTMAYIYIASCILEPDAPAWPDMEFAIYLQDPAWICHGGKPTILEAAEMAFLFAGGSSAVNSARNQRKNVKSTINPKNFRGFRNPNMFMLRVLLHRLNVTTRPEENHKQALLGTAAETLVPSLIQALNDPDNQKRMLRQLNSSSNITSLPLAHNGGTPRDPRPLEVLGVLVNWLQADRIDLYFDWRTFQRQYTKNWSEFSARSCRTPSGRMENTFKGLSAIRRSLHSTFFSSPSILKQRSLTCA